MAYQEEVTKRITDLDMEVCSVEEGWVSWRDAVMDAAEARRKDWISRRTENLLRQRKRAKLAKTPLIIDRQVRSSAREDKQKWLDSVGVDMETAAHSGEHLRTYQLVKHLSGRCASGTLPVKGDDGTPLKDREEVKSRWADYFNDLLNHPPPEEVTPNWAYGRASRTFLRSPDYDGKSNAEVEEQQGPWAQLSLYRPCINCWEDETGLDDWAKSLICTIFKQNLNQQRTVN